MSLLNWIFGARKKKVPRALTPPSAPAAPPPIPVAAEAKPPAPAKPSPPQKNADRPKGHIEAAGRIAAYTAKRKAAKTWLDLSGLGLTTLPPEIKQLADLRFLNLNANALSDDALAPLASMVNIEQLRLRRNQLSGACFTALKNLPALTFLDISHNKKVGPNVAGMAALTGLTTLHADNVDIDSVGAQTLASLVQLNTLHLHTNRLGNAGAAALATLTKLKTLELGNNGIGPDGLLALSALTSLQSLNLERNRDIKIGAPLAGLTALKTLDISHTGVADLQFTDALKKLRTLGLNGLQLKTEEAERLNRKGLRVHLHKAKLGDFPPEALSSTSTLDCMPKLRQHIDARKDDKTVEVRDVKVMLLGNGRVGKTQLRLRLKNAAYDDQIGTTHGVEIVPINLTPAPDAAPGAAPIPVQLWDFGGQDIYLGTHALFMKTRAVFPLLWTPTSEENEFHVSNGVRYRNYPLNEWLRYVQQLAGEESPVLLIQSQCEKKTDHIKPPKIDAQLFGRFTREPDDLYYSARLGEPHADILSKLRQAIESLTPEVSGGAEAEKRNHIPVRWNNVKMEVERQAKTQKRITRADFIKICNAKFVTEPEKQNVLLTMLHDFGTLFHDPDVLGDLIVLDQNWALGAIYAVFDRETGTHEKLKGMNGRFTRTDLGDLVWNATKRYTTEDQAAFVDMMVACKAAFELRPASETHGEALYIAPDLLPERSHVEPQFARYEADVPDAERRFEFVFALPSMLRELMGSWAADAGQRGVYWQEGLFFKKSRSYVIVEALRPGDRSWAATVRIRAWRGDAAAVVERLSEALRTVAERFSAQAVEGAEDQLDPLVGSEDEFEAGEPQVEPEAIEPDDPQEPSQPERCFISYAWGGDRPHGPGDTADSARNRELAFNRVAARLRVLGLDPFFDKERLRHGESISEFIATGTTSPKFAIILSKRYLNDSRWCMDELVRIWRHCRSNAAEFRACTRVVLLDDAKIDEAEERFAVTQSWIAEAERELATQAQYTKAGLPTPIDVGDRLRVAKDLTHCGSDILAHILLAYPIRTISEIDDLTF